MQGVIRVNPLKTGWRLPTRKQGNCFMRIFLRGIVRGINRMDRLNRRIRMGIGGSFLMIIIGWWVFDFL